MRSALAIVFVVAAGAAGSAAAQSRVEFRLAPTLVPLASSPQEQNRALTMPVIDYVAPDGRIAVRRGIIAGVAVSPNSSFGLGIFEGAPKRRPGAADPAKPERGSKRAAIGFSLRF